MGGGLWGEAFPPDVAIVGEGDVGEDGVFLHGFHGDAVGLPVGAGGDAEEAGLGVDGVEFAVLVGPEPCDVVADDGGFPAFFRVGFWRDEHGEVGLSAGGGEGGGEVGFGAVWCVDAEDEHVFCHPFVLAGDVAGDAEGEAFFPEEGVAAVAGAVGDDFAGFDEVGDVFVFVAGPWDVCLAVGEGGADGVGAFDELGVAVAFFRGGAGGFVFEALEDVAAHVGHDAHVDDDVGAVCDLDADFCEG